jgi:hypothetical protein
MRLLNFFYDRTLMSSDSESRHASSEDLAAYLSRGLSREERAAVERHLAECESCRDELAAAQELLSRRKRPMQMGGAMAIAAVAVALLLVVRTPPERVQSVEKVPLSRGTEAPAAAISTIEPQNDAVTSDSAIVFRWAPSGTDMHYRITVMSEAGDAVWSGETADSRITLPAGVRLAPKSGYVWYVDATRAGRDSVSSGPVAFRTR